MRPRPWREEDFDCGGWLKRLIHGEMKEIMMKREKSVIHKVFVFSFGFAPSIPEIIHLWTQGHTEASQRLATWKLLVHTQVVTLPVLWWSFHLPRTDLTWRGRHAGIQYSLSSAARSQTQWDGPPPHWMLLCMATPWQAPTRWNTCSYTPAWCEVSAVRPDIQELLQESTAIALLARILWLRFYCVWYGWIRWCIVGIYVWNGYAMGSANIQVQVLVL